MPFYEYECSKCGARKEVFLRSMNAEAKAPVCDCNGTRKRGIRMDRAMSAFARHRTLKDQMAEAEARFGKEVDDAMGASPDIDKHAQHYDQVAKELPPE
jgi:putative FmdB family regulatory protein